MSRSFQHRWHNRKQLFSSPVPEAVKEWLFDPASLTARLIRLCADSGKGDFRVQLIDQRLANPARDEREVLDIGNNRWALVRQVKLLCDDTPMVYARTVIPTTTLTGRQRQYGNLGNRPLGAMLFADNSMRRERVMVTSIGPDDALHKMTQTDETVWGRRSVFYVADKPLLVSEYYLPSLVACTTKD